MGLTPTYQKDPLAPLKLRPGMYAQVYFPSKEPATDTVAGERAWLKVKTVDRDDGSWVGIVDRKPSANIGVHKGQEITLMLEAVEHVSVERPTA